MTTLVDVELERAYRAFWPEGHAPWWEWIGAHVELDDVLLTEVELGEGELRIEYVTNPPEVDGDDLVLHERRIAHADAPPCWPSWPALEHELAAR